MPQDEIRPITMTAQQAAQFIGISYWQILELSKHGEIPHVKIGGRKLFRKEAIDRWITERESGSMKKEPDTIA